MSEVAHASEDHGEAEAVGGFNDFLIAHGSPRLNDRSCACLCDLLYAVGKREKGIGRCDGPLQRELRFHRADLA
jgi:hypothetical protein